MKVQNLHREEVFRSLVTSESGLAKEEAGRRFAEYGPNEIKEARKESLLFRFLRQTTHFLAVLLWTAALLAFLSEYMSPGEGMVRLGIAIVVVIVINAIFTFIQEYRAEKALEALKKLLPFHVKVIRSGNEKEILSREIVPGDVIVISEGDRVPADARLIETTALKVSNAPLTGESEPVLRNHEPYQGEFLESPNIVFAGTTVISGSGRAVVFATAMSTEFGRIAHLTGAVESGLSPLQKEIVKATRVVATIAAAVGIVFFLLGFAIGSGFWSNFIFAIGITVALIPEGMLPTVTLALALGSQRMAARKALIRTLTSVETLGSVTIICTDKTGTLTRNSMAVSEIWIHDRKFKASDLTAESAPQLFQTALFCTNARYADGDYLGDPTEAAIYRMARELFGDRYADRIREIPFDSERKRMTTVNVIDGKVFAFTKGALEHVLPLCSHILAGNERVILDDLLQSSVKEEYFRLMDSGLRVLAFAYNELEPGRLKISEGQSEAADQEIETNLVFAGLVGLEDPPRPEVAAAIEKCHNAGIKIIMITGDGSRTALAIAREIGLIRETPVIIEGHKFDRMTDMELRERLSAPEVIFARMTPKHKMRVVTVLKEEGEVVAVTGDGVNDAPALKKADIGIAMGISGTDVAKEASDMVLLDDNFATIVNAVEEGRTVYENIKKFITYIFASNIPEAVPYLAYILLNIPLPLTIMQILAVDLGTDMLPALALGAEKPFPGVMKKPPRKRTERLLNLSLLGRAYLFLGLIEAGACMFGYFLVLYSGGWTWGKMLPQNDLLYMQATTACLTAIIITQVGNVFACRSSSESIFSPGFFSNRLIFFGIGAELLLQLFIVYHPWGNTIFSTSPLPLSVWLVLIPFAVVLLAAEELRKFVVRMNRSAFS